jgi:hypothetical protein
MRVRLSAAGTFGLLALLVAGFAAAQRSYDTDILADTFGFNEDTPKSVSLDDLHQGCPHRDCIPSIDHPKYLNADAADFLADDDVVIALAWEGKFWAFPARILDHHEIVNDTFAGTPLAITWCPLCGSAVGVKRTINNIVTEFGVSGVLYNSDLVFYDRATETLWDQIEAKGIVGPLTGESLEFVPVSMTTWGRWRTAHPDTLVLSTVTGFDEDYTADYYADYRSSDGLMFPVLRQDDRTRPKTVVFGFEFDDIEVAFAEPLIQEHGSVTKTLNGAELTVSMADDGTVTLETGDGEKHAPIRLFWFAWYTFHPETTLFD